MDKNDQEEATFACHKGLFEFNVMPFGLLNTLAVFQELMSVVLQGCSNFATAYLDVIMILLCVTVEEHLEHLSMLFERLREHEMKLKLKKCKSETNYLWFDCFL